MSTHFSGTLVDQWPRQNHIRRNEKDPNNFHVLFSISIHIRPAICSFQLCIPPDSVRFLPFPSSVANDKTKE